MHKGDIMGHEGVVLRAAVIDQVEQGAFVECPECKKFNVKTASNVARQQRSNKAATQQASKAATQQASKAATQQASKAAPKAARQQDSKAARQQGSRRQQGSKAV